MLVRDLEGGFQIVLQPDHGDLSGQIARAWRWDEGLPPHLAAGLMVAAARHDDGWAVWERRPRLDEAGRPQRFDAVPRRSLLSSYRACADLAGEAGPAAGLLVSMHVSGLQRNRYGVMGGETTPLEDLEPAIAEFVGAEEARQAHLAAELAVPEPELRRAYWLLQVYDVMSLFLGLADLERAASRVIDLPPAPTSRKARRLELAAGGALSVGCHPFPFGPDQVAVRMRRRMLGGRSGGGGRRWSDEEAFHADFGAAEVEEVEISLVPGGPAG